MNEQPDEQQWEPYIRPTEINLQIRDDLRLFDVDFGNEDFALRGPGYIFGARRGVFGASAWLDDISYVFNNVALQLRAISDVEPEGDEISAILEYNFAVRDSQFVSAESLQGWEALRHERVRFRSETQDENGRSAWEIVSPATLPGALTSDRDVPQDDNFWNVAAFYLSQQQPYQSPFTPAKRSLQKLKILSLSALMFYTDFDARYALDSRYIVAALKPYLRALKADVDSTFRVPDANENYSFNSNLEDQKIAADWQTSNTVLFYEGHNETPIFRYNGKAAIGFADGHAALVSRDKAKNLIWKP